MKPDAATFTPRTFAAAMMAGMGDVTDTPTKTEASKHDPFSAIPESAATAMTIKYPAAAPTVSVPDKSSSVQPAEDGQQPGNRDDNETTNTNPSKSKRIKLKYPRYSRRIQSKSEPSSSSNSNQT